MHTLANLQQAFQSHLLKDDESIIQQLVWPVNGLLDDRLDVYANAYRWRLIDALQKEYGLLHTYLGDEQFGELAEAYIDEYPSRFYSISGFTRQLPQFLLTLQPEKAYLSELAGLIRALSQSLEAEDAPVLKPTTLAEIPIQNWPSLCFKFHPSVQCLSFQWNTFAFWKALVQKTVPPRLYSQQLGFRQVLRNCEPSGNAAESSSAKSMHQENSYCIVWRKQLQSYANSLTEQEAVAFQALQLGSCFAESCEAVAAGCAKEAEAATLVANCITRWLHDHLFSEVYIP
ncbi:MAG: DNA-binding domain-containing protein [Rickettsia endosymbiont of Ixodes persulcatus]|nr:DNA-binding domain-containing protein [Rickettsia endosymbiont of Ixodes persulcatus]